MFHRQQRAGPGSGAIDDVRTPAGALAACGAWALGTDRLQRRRLQLILVAAGVYGLSMLAQWNAVVLGMADREHAAWLAAFIGTGVCTAFAAVRSGVTARLADPALALPQMVLGILAIALAYAINPQVRALMPMLAGLVIMFAAFTLEPRRCIALGLFGVLAFAVTIALCAWCKPELFPRHIEAHHLVFVVITLPAMAYLASRMSQLRLHWRQQRRELKEALDNLSAGQEALVRAKAGAEAASQAKTRFLANMSHELRTPLNAVIGAAQLLRAQRADAGAQPHLVEAIEQGGTNLLGLIENILDISRIEAGHLKLRPADFDLIECVESAITGVAPVAHAKGLQLACVVAPGLAAWRHGDRDLLRQLVMNLLGNAVKFTAHGEVVLRVRAGARPCDVHVSVSDTGVGIGEASLAHVFEPFRQADDGADRRFGGSGLGLAIVRQLAQAMGGSVGVTSVLGRGSCFEFELPLPASEQLTTAPAALSRVVVVIEPHEPSAEALLAHLQRLGAEARRCTDPAGLRDALSCSRGAPLPWVLLAADSDDGFTLLEPVADLVEPSQVVAMAGHSSDAVERARSLPASARALVKPITRAALIAALSDADPLTAVPSIPAPPAPAPRLETGFQRLTHVLVVDDDALNRSIVSGLLRHAGFCVFTADSGHRVLQLLPELDRIDVVLMDCQMPGMDGLEVTRRLRAGEAGPAGCTVPILALTANAFAEDRQACIAAGMNDFLSKPVKASTLHEAIRRWTAAAPNTAAADAGASAPAPGPAPVFDPAVLAALPMVADGSEPGFALEMLAQYLKGSSDLVQRCSRALAAGDAAAVRLGVHTLRSTSAQVGARALADLAGAIEERLRAGAPFDDGDLNRLLHQHRLAVASITAHLRHHRAESGSTA
jgi:signal transduction histidine kinase/CheY-like chemotaxis protein/HPt (histidine-containing phosphotransfer) domain-containing protein